MSLIRLEEVGDGQGETEAHDRTDYERNFLGLSNTINDREPDILRSSICPKEGGRDIHDPRARINRVRARRFVNDEPGIWWLVSYSASTYIVQPEENPLSKRAKISMVSQTENGYTTRDLDGRPITTSAGTLMKVPIRETKYIFNVSVNLTTLPFWMGDMQNAVNNGHVTIRGVPCPRHSLMLMGLGGDDTETRVNGQHIKYVVVTFQLWLNKKLWLPVRVPDADFVELTKWSYFVKRVDRRGRVIMRNGEPQYERSPRKDRLRIYVGQPPTEVSEPWPLDKDGQALPENYRPEDVRYKEPKVIPELSYARLMTYLR